MVSLFQAIILGIIQGITEWLPISSSGHLVLAQYFFSLEKTVAFDVMLHLGTLVVLFIFFRKELIELAYGILKRDKKSINFLVLIVIATIPTALFGFFFKDFLESLFSNMIFTGVGFIITAVWIFLSRFPKKKDKELSYAHAFFIGCAQAISIVPSISRSGATIATGLLLGVKKEETAKFSFIISIPAIMGAAILTLKDITEITDVGPTIIGVIVAAVAGYLSLAFLMDIIKKDRFQWFALYCLIMGLVVLGIALL
jgi:undecaprenyl-diphosphatase